LLSPDSHSVHALGYNALAISFDVSAGSGPRHLSLVEGPIDEANVRVELGRVGVQPASTGAVVRFTITKRKDLPSSNVTDALSGVHTLAVLGHHDRAAAGGSKVPPIDVTNLLQGSHPSHSLASDPEVRQTLGLLAGADTMLFGASLPFRPLAMAVADDPAINRLPAAATFAGYGFLPGDATHATAVAVAIYPNAGDAKAAAEIVGNVLRYGYSYYEDEPYARLFAVDSVTVHGDAVVARVTAHRHTHDLAWALGVKDFPLFWSPRPKT
jgi:hypothetical protein